MKTTNEIKRARIREVDVLRGLAIIFMVTGHSFIVHPINIQSVPWCASLCHWIYTFHMELFFLLAGCVYHCSKYRKYISKKIDRLVVPYLFFGIISLILHSVGLDAVNKQTTFTAGLIKLLLQGGSYWFLYALFVLYLIFPLIEKICKSTWMEMGIAIACLLLYEFVELPHIFEIGRVVYYIPYFILGRYMVKLLQSNKVNNLFLNIALFVMFLAIFILLDRLCDVYSNLAIIKYARAIAMILVVYVPVHYLLIWADSGNKIGGLIECFLQNCSTYSLQLYLFNGFVLVGVRTLIVSVLHIQNPVVIVSSIVIGNLLVTLLICNYLLPRTKWLAWLCGTGERPFGKK